MTAIDYPIAACGPAGAPTATAPAAAPPRAAKRWTEPVEQEGNPRDEEILRPQNRLEQLERLLDRQQDPVLRRVGPSRQVAKKER